MSALPPGVLTGDAAAAAAAAAGAEKSTVVASFYGTVVGGSAAVGWQVHLFADPEGHNIICGSDIAGLTVKATVTVGFVDDGSVLITATS